MEVVPFWNKAFHQLTLKATFNTCATYKKAKVSNDHTEEINDVKQLLSTNTPSAYCRAKEKRRMNLRELPNFLW